MTKLCCFNEDHHFLPSQVVCWWLWKEPVCWWWTEDADLETIRVTAVQRRIVHGVLNRVSLQPLILLREYRTVCLQPVQHDILNAEQWGLSWLNQHNFAIFTYISTKLDDKMYILLLNSCVKSYRYAKTCMQRWNINKSRLGYIYIRTVVLLQSQ